MMSPKAKLVVGGVGAAAVTSSVVMSSVALATQGTSVVKEDDKEKDKFKDLTDKVTNLETSIDTKISAAVKTAMASLPTPITQITKEQFETVQSDLKDLTDRVTALETSKPAGDEVPAEVANPEIEGLKAQLGKITKDLEGLKTKVEKPGVDVSKHSSVIALEQQARSFKESLSNLENKLNGLDEKLKTQDRKIEDEISFAETNILNKIDPQVAEVNDVLEEVKKLSAEIKELQAKLEKVQGFSDNKTSMDYLKGQLEANQEQWRSVNNRIQALEEKHK